MTKRTLTLWVIGGLLAPALVAAELPNEPLICPADDPELDKYQYARALSIDLRGVAPAYAEYTALHDIEDVPEAMVAGWLETDAFADRAVRQHRDLMWGNVTNVNLFNTRARLARWNVSGGIYWVSNRAITYRGDRVQCLNQAATFNADGTVQTFESIAADGDVSQREGWVTVNPYWAPQTTVKVCWYDAQVASVSPSGTDCAQRDGLSDVGCGCGPNMNFCHYGSVNTEVTGAFATDVELRVAAMIQEDEPYTALFTSKRAFVNGPLVHYLKYQTPFHANFQVVPSPITAAELPALEYADKNTWVEIELGDHHAGILTSFLFLARFQTQRARANSFYNNFLCQPFQPPQGGIPINEEALNVADLQERAGCKYCHSLLEPSAAFWGRYTEGGAGYMHADEYPAFSDECYTCATIGQQCSPKCTQAYLTKAPDPEQVPFLGMLKSYEFRKDEHKINVEMGPEVLALTAVVDHRLPTCVAHTTAKWLLGRELYPEEGDWLADLAVDFVQSEYSYAKLVKAIVTSPVYRRVR